ncbi:MAG: DUF3347 domain-containing protein [FCB group bacterium]|nr:DUF3347 domain-containing protein [FCB group bacterium]
MNRKANLKTVLKQAVPTGGPAIVGILIVAILAFSLGLLLSGGDTPLTDSTGHDHVDGGRAEPTVWTCSMHPQIKLPKAGKCPICFMDLIPLESDVGEELDPRQIRMSETAKQLAQIEVTRVKRTFAEAEVRMVGKVAYDETNVAYITAWVPGRLDNLYADFTGMTVNKGDHLVYMYSPELLAAQEELLQARSALAALTNTDSRILKSTADVTLEAAHEKLRLYGLTEQQVEEIETTGETSDHLTIYSPIGGVVVHKNALEGMYVTTGTRIYTIADLSRLWIIFEAYESDLPWLRYGQSVAFTSPSFPGETFEATVSFIDPVVDAKTRTVHVRAIFDNSDFKLKPDMFVRAVVKSRIDNEGNIIDKDLAGKWISPMHPEVVKDGPGSCDVCGMALVKAESLGYAGRRLADEDAPLIIPASAPLITGKRAVVYVELPNDEGPLYEGREVQLGPRAGDLYVVKSGLVAGEMVVTNGNFKIDSELQIRAKPSMMSLASSVSVVSNNNQSLEQAASYKAGSAERVEISQSALSVLSPLYNSYFDVQMGLADDDLSTAIEALNQIAENISDVDMSLFEGDGHLHWMNLADKLKSAVSAGKASPDIVEARNRFYHLSNVIIELHDTFGHAEGEEFYLTFCPMARKNKGAFWLQTVDTVYNSFYGKSMLRCGSIKQTLASETRTGSK